MFSGVQLTLISFLSAASAAVAQEDSLQLPEQTSFQQKVQFCVSVDRAQSYAIFHGAYLKSQSDQSGVIWPWVGQVLAPSAALIYASGGQNAFERSVSKASTLDLYWKDYGETFFSNFGSASTEPFVSPIGLELAQAYSDCVEFIEASQFDWFVETQWVQVSALEAQRPSMLAPTLEDP